MALNEGVLRIALRGKTFSQSESAAIVGSRYRLFKLIERGAVKAEKKPSNKQNGRWYCDAFDVIAHARVKGL